MHAVQIDSVSKSYGDFIAVSDLSLSVPAGSIYGFIGPNGSGKTTTLRMILNIIHPDTGSIEVLGQKDARAANDRVGYLPEERGLYKKMKVRHLLAYYGALKGMSPRDAKQGSEEWLERFNLADAADRKIEALSKGMAQKVQFIATVLAKPEMIILDEPFSGLDPVNLEAIRQSVLELSKSGTTVIFSTHDMSMAEKMCDFIFMIFKGNKVLDGTLDSIQETYGSDTIRLRIEAGQELLERHPLVNNVINVGQYQEVRVNGDPQELLSSLVAQTRVSLFEIARPSLQDIFVRIAGPEAERATEESAAQASAS